MRPETPLFKKELKDIPIARANDLPASKIAAVKMNEGKRLKNIHVVLDVMRRIKKRGAYTSREVFFNNQIYFESHGISKHEVSRRISDLKSMMPKMVEYISTRRCAYTCKSLSTYQAV